MITEEKQDRYGHFEIITKSTRCEKPLVSVIMSTYNDELSIEESMASILNQTFNDFEFIIINDVSKDKTLEKVKHYVDCDKRVVLINNQENIGLTKSLIRGINLSAGTYIARQDGDDQSAPDRLSQQLAYLPQYDLVCCRTKINNKKISPKPISVLFYRYVLYLKNVFVHGSFIFKRELYDKIGGYNEAFVYAQDYDFITRAVRTSCKIKFLKEVLYYSRKSEESLSRQYLDDQNQYAMQVKQRYRLNIFERKCRL